MELNSKQKNKQSRSERNKKEFYRYIFFMGLLLALGIAVLKSVEYYYFAYRITTDVYIGIISVIFLGLGLYIGFRYSKKRNPPQIIPEAAKLPQDIELSSREMEVLQNIAQGHSNQEIADRLFVSLNTVKSHTNNIYSKLNVRRRTQAIEKARKLNLIQ
jgi:DNA-binding CsgD family transcriptional regulator